MRPNFQHEIKKAASAAFFTTTSRYLLWTGLAIYGLSWLSYDHYRPWVNFHAEMMAWTGLVLISWGLFIKRKLILSMPSWGWVLVSLTLLPWLQYLGRLNYFAGDALMSSLYMAGFLIVVVLGYTCGQKQALKEAATVDKSFFLCLCVVSAVSAVIGLFQWLGQGGMLGMYIVQVELGSRAMGNLGQPNQLSILLLLGMLGTTYLRQHRHLGDLAWGLILGLLALVLAMTASRAGMLGALAMMGFLIWKIPKCEWGPTKSSLLKWGGLILLAYIAVPLLGRFLMLGGGRTVESLVQSSSGRWEMWGQILRGIQEAPWLGYGWNQTTAAQREGALFVSGSIPTDYAHNLVLDLMAWCGVPLGLALSLAIGWWFVDRARRIQTPQSIFAMAALLPMLVYSMVEYPFAYAYFLIAMGFFVGLIEAAVPRDAPAVVGRRLAASALFVWAALGIGVVYEYVQVEEDYRVVRFQMQRIGQTEEEYEVPTIRGLTQLRHLLAAGRVDPLQEADPETIELVQQAAVRYFNRPIDMKYILLLGMNDQAEVASVELKRLRNFYGEAFYKAAVLRVRELETEGYTQLRGIQAP